MKRTLSAAAFALLFATAGLAQQEKAIEPENLSVFYYLRPSGQLVELERQTPEQGRKGVNVLFTIGSEKSPVRFSAADPVQFVVRVTEDFQKATATIQLFRFAPQNGNRQVIVRRSDLASNKASLKVTTEKYGDSSLKVSPAQKLEPGEYCISRTTIAQGYCFGLDAAGTQ